MFPPSADPGRTEWPIGDVGPGSGEAGLCLGVSLSEPQSCPCRVGMRVLAGWEVGECVRSCCGVWPGARVWCPLEPECPSQGRFHSPFSASSWKPSRNFRRGSLPSFFPPCLLFAAPISACTFLEHLSGQAGGCSLEQEAALPELLSAHHSELCPDSCVYLLPHFSGSLATFLSFKTHIGSLWKIHKCL